MELELILAKVKEQVKTAMAEDKPQLEALVKQIIEQGGGATKEQKEAIDKLVEKSTEKLEAAVKAQGTLIDDLKDKMNRPSSIIKSPVEVLLENKKSIKDIQRNAMGNIRFELNRKGKDLQMFRTNDKGMPEATINGVLAPENTAAVAEALTSASVMRMGASSPILEAFTETQWIFGLANMANTNNPFVVYWEEDVANHVGSPSLVAEGGRKPVVHYKYKLVAQTYKKSAAVLSFTNEFELDFGDLYETILNKTRREVMIDMQSRILLNVINSATAYSTAAEFTALGGVQAPNPHDAIVAMATEVNAQTFTQRANVSILNDYSLGRIGVEKDAINNYLNKPEIVRSLSYFGHAGVPSTSAIVGDLSQYNILLKGGLGIRMGYNGEDMVHNMFTVVVEQFYYDYIPEVRQAAIVTGDLLAIMSSIAATT